MNREKIKTLLLVVLFITSIILTNEIWIKVPSSLVPMFSKEDTVAEKSYNLKEIVSPKKYLLNFGGSDANHTVLYSGKDYGLWEIGTSFLKELFNGEISLEIMNDEEFLESQNNISLDYYFDNNLDLYLISKIINTNIPRKVYNQLSRVKSIHISLQNINYAVFSDGKKHLKIKGSNIEVRDLRKIVSLIREEDYKRYTSLRSMNYDSDEYVLLQNKYKVEKVIVENEIDNRESEEVNNIARKFYDRELDYIRKIEEDNGTIIFLHKGKTLKIYNNGVLEYFNSLDDTVIERDLYKSFNSALRFISNHMGFPQNVYLSSIEEIEVDRNQGYKFLFEYNIKGLPVKFNEKISSAPLEIDVFNENVTYYKRFVRRKMELPKETNDQSETVVIPFDILNNKNNFNYILKDYATENEINMEDLNRDQITGKILSSINDISLVYYDPYTEKSYENLKVAWIISINDRDYIFDIYTGERIGYDKMDGVE
ncbi:hypothetical protein [Dethiothermospora halolimnae]|uniref:hypothetical protein n=1 Tax=Dethiothermospora halolimnae TaxID=3114390 RepID=UPI003CCBC7FA